MKNFIKMSKYAGMREDLVQAGGGNSSFKIDANKMIIKASGVQLTEMTEKSGYAEVNPEIIRKYFCNPDLLKKIKEENGKQILEEAFLQGERPSIETFLHAVSGKYTLHTHPIVVNILCCRKNGMGILEEMFPESLCVGYATPGILLAKKYFEAYIKKRNQKEKEVSIVFLQNHGMVVSGNTAEDVIKLTEEITQKIEKYLDIDMSSYHEATKIAELFCNDIIWRVTDINALTTSVVFEGEWEHRFCPDCIVFLGKKFFVLPENAREEALEKFLSLYGEPIVILYKKNIYIKAQSVKKALEIQSILSFSAQVMHNNLNVQIEILSEQEQNFLLNWDAEKYRKSIKS